MSHQNAPPRDHPLSQIYRRNRSGPFYTILSNENGPARLIRHQRLFDFSDAPLNSQWLTVQLRMDFRKLVIFLPRDRQGSGT